MEQRSRFALSEHLEKPGGHGDRLEGLVDFEYFGAGGSRLRRRKYGRPPFDPVFGPLTRTRGVPGLTDRGADPSGTTQFWRRADGDHDPRPAVLDAVSRLRSGRTDDGREFVREIDPEARFPENTIRHFRNRLTETGTLDRVMKAFDWQLRKKVYIAMSGRIVDANLVMASRQRNTEDEKAAIKAGNSTSSEAVYTLNASNFAQKTRLPRVRQLYSLKRAY